MKVVSRIFLLAFGVFLSCAQETKTDHDFIGKLLDLATATTSPDFLGEEYVQLTNLYDSLSYTLPEDKDERIILVDRLKLRGFEVVHRGRGNFPPPGPRIVLVELKKGHCVCEVSKIYYAVWGMAFRWRKASIAKGLSNEKDVEVQC
jgi:hypothetical protein